MRKVEGWEDRLHHFLIENREKPFEWGSWDCCKFVDAAVVSMTTEHLIPAELTWTNE